MRLELDKAEVNRAPPTEGRLLSLDVFRAWVVVLMTLVNYLSPVKGVPWWAKHMPEAVDGYTFVDVVFPAFLFMVGMSIPFALARRLERGDSPWALARKIVVRSAALLFLGVLTVNDHMYAADIAPLSKSLWFLLAMLCAVTLCLGPPAQATEGRRRGRIGLKVLAAAGLAVLLCLFRGKDEAGHIVWLQHSYWGMLGMIGWAYLVGSIAWLIFRDNSTALMGATTFMLALYVGGRHGALDWLGPIQSFVNVGINFGSNPATVLIGVLVANCLRARERGCFSRSGLDYESAAQESANQNTCMTAAAETAAPRPGSESLATTASAAPLRFILLFGVGLYLAGSLVRPLHGIHKSPHTEAYVLVTGGICCVVFAGVYYLVDVLQARRGCGFLLPIGQNALLAYLLPEMVASLLGVFGLSVYWRQSGWPGAWCAAGLTVVILSLTWMLSRCRIRLRL